MEVYVASLGCRLNEAERGHWIRELRSRGHRVTGRPEHADVMVLNTCAVTAKAGKTSRQTARAMHRRNPRARLVLTGCFGTLEPESAAALAGVDLVVPNADKDVLPDRLEALDVSMPVMAEAPDADPVADSHTRAFVKVQDGCSNRCTFCIVTVARGEERSRSIDDIVFSCQGLEAEGLREVVLTGVHLGGYGSDLGVGLTDLIRGVLDRTTLPWIRFGSLEPWDLDTDFFGLWSDDRLCPHLHLPLQSGCDATLRRMGRRCDTEGYRRLADAAEAAGITLTTDVMVGFPGETEAEFAESLAFVEAMGFADLHVFRWSVREGTAAARMRGRVPGDVARERSEAMRALGQRMRADRLQREVGGTRRVHWEGQGQAVDGGWAWQGYTRSYLRATTIVPDPVDLRDRIETVRLTGSEGDHLVVERMTPSVRSD